MFYAALLFQLVFIVVNWMLSPVQSKGERIKLYLESFIPVVALVFRIDWLLILSMVAYGLIIWDMIMNWIIPVFPLAYAFSLKNLITGKTTSMIKNAPVENTLPAFHKPKQNEFIVIFFAVLALIATIIFYENTII